MKISFTNALRVSFTFLFALCVSSVFAQIMLKINNTDIVGNNLDVGTVDFGLQEIGSLTGDLITMTDQLNLGFCSISYSKQTPQSQIVPLNVTFGHTNRANVPQENVHLTCEITDPVGSVTVIDTMLASVDTLPPDEFWFTSPFTRYTPTMPGEYTVRFYNNGADMTNYLEGIDEEAVSFIIIEEDIFRQDDGSEPFGLVDNDSPNNWGLGNIYTIANRAEALSVSFALGAPANLVNENIDIVLYKLDPNGDGNIDEDGDGMFGGLISAELDLANIISNQSHTVSADDVPNELITLGLLPFNNDGILEGTPENPGYYILVLEYTTGGSTDTLNISSTAHNDLQSTPLVIRDINGVEIADIGGSMTKSGDDWESLNGVFQPLIHLHVSPPLVNLNQPELENHEVSLMPNPTSENVQVVFDLSESSDAVEVSLFNLTGQVISSEIHNNLYKDTLTMDVSQLPSGVYFVHVSTNKGRKTLRLVVK